MRLRPRPWLMAVLVSVAVLTVGTMAIAAPGDVDGPNLRSVAVDPQLNEITFTFDKEIDARFTGAAEFCFYDEDGTDSGLHCGLGSQVSGPTVRIGYRFDSPVETAVRFVTRHDATATFGGVSSAVAHLGEGTASPDLLRAEAVPDQPGVFDLVYDEYLEYADWDIDAFRAYTATESFRPNGISWGTDAPDRLRVYFDPSTDPVEDIVRVADEGCGGHAAATGACTTIGAVPATSSTGSTGTSTTNDGTASNTASTGTSTTNDGTASSTSGTGTGTGCQPTVTSATTTGSSGAVGTATSTGCDSSSTTTTADGGSQGTSSGTSTGTETATSTGTDTATSTGTSTGDSATAGGTGTSGGNAASAGTGEAGGDTGRPEGSAAGAATGSSVGTSTGAAGPPPPDGPVGISIEGGRTFTRSADVDLSVVWPRGARVIAVANDGGFRRAEVRPLLSAIRWRLDSSGAERLPKTVYARFAADGPTYQDDIVLDETAPRLVSVRIVGGPRAGSAGASARTRYVLRVSARDATSGISGVQVTTDRSRPGRVRRFARRLAFRASSRRIFVRVRDRAGNFSRWRRATG